MKKLLMLLVTGALYTWVITNYASAQAVSNISYPVPATVSAYEEKPALTHAVDPIDKTVLKEMKANLRAAKASLKITNDFSKHFKNARDVKWNTEEKAIIATFKKDDKSTRVVYDKKGNWVYTIITYYEDQMPADIRALVKSAYNDFTISLVHEISQGGYNIYKVHLEDSTRLKQVLVYNNEITVYNEFTKSR